MRMSRLLALLIGVLLAVQGIVGIVAPDVFVGSIRFIQTPPVLYVAAVLRVVFGVVLVCAAPGSRAPTFLRVFGASLDGLAINHDSVVEIKCGDSVYRRTSQSRCVPDYYYGQMQHILAVTGLDSLDFWCYWPGCPELLILVARDDGYIECLLNRELEFWSLVR